jgi:hypothetical protein
LGIKKYNLPTPNKKKSVSIEKRKKAILIPSFAYKKEKPGPFN